MTNGGHPEGAGSGEVKPGEKREIPKDQAPDGASAPPRDATASGGPKSQAR